MCKQISVVLKGLSRVILAGQDWAEINEITVGEGALTLRGRYNQEKLRSDQLRGDRRSDTAAGGRAAGVAADAGVQVGVRARAPLGRPARLQRRPQRRGVELVGALDRFVQSNDAVPIIAPATSDLSTGRVPGTISALTPSFSSWATADLNLSSPRSASTAAIASSCRVSSMAIRMRR